MARIEVEYFSNALVRPITFRVVLPNDPRAEVPGIQKPYNPHIDRPMKNDKFMLDVNPAFSI